MSDRHSRNSHLRSRLHQYRRNRRKFACTVYGLAALFALLSFLQWLPMLLVQDYGEVFQTHFWIAIACLFLSLVVVTIFVFFENMRFLFPLNWLLTIIIVESLTYGLARIVVDSNLTLVGTCFGVIALITILFLVIGICIEHDLTLDIVIIFVISIVFFIGSVFFIMLHITVGIPYSVYIYSSFVIITILLFVMYHAQTINGGRYAEMRLNDYLLAALIIYHDFIIIFILSFYISSKLTGSVENE